MSLRAGDWVEVRSKDEILATLDESACLEDLPFMPEMFQYCGKRFRVWKRAHKTCDTVNKTGGRRLKDSVHLEELRCDGQDHGGCGAACLLFWKEAWLKADHATHESATRKLPVITEARVRAVTERSDGSDGGVVYSCQATSLPKATTLLPWWDVRQYVEDVASGNVAVSELFGGAVYVGYHALVNRSARYSQRASRGLVAAYDTWQRWVGGVPYPRKQGTIPAGKPTPSRRLNLVQGDVVRARSYPEILATLDTNNRNKGMYFDAEEVPYCGKHLRVRGPVDKIIHEATGKMIHLKDKNVILEGAICRGHYSDRRMHCPRAIYSIWRETWLERAQDAPDGEALASQ